MLSLMCNFTLNLRSTLLALLVTVAASCPGFAQIQYASAVAASAYTNSSLDNLAVDKNVTTAATLRPTLLGGTIADLAASYLRLQFASTIPAGQQVYFIVKPNNPLTVSLLENVKVITYKQTGTGPFAPLSEQERFPLSTLLGVSTNMDNTAPTTASFVPSPGKAFDHLELRISGVNIGTDLNFYEAYTSATPLPVTLTAFTGKATPTGVALKWATASERNADYFEVQRAEGSSEAFHSLGQVKCFGSSNQAHSYQFADAAPAGRHYYRLRQVDADGKEAFSPVVTIEGGALATALAAYPTLATTTLTVTGPAGMHLNVFNQQGQQVQVADIAASQMQQLDVHSLPSGIYFLRDAATGQSTRFVKTGDER
ncbi:MAG: T9SS type A sorting domain-containing protein [Hymenobacter sp.]|nr:MAG: T9SS type A sorting domain-containing protein [Hymenobacter sp.]